MSSSSSSDSLSQFTLYFHEVLSQQHQEQQHASFGEADGFLFRHLQKFQSDNSIKVPDFRQKAIYYGKSYGSNLVKQFYHQLTILKNRNRTHRRNLLVDSGLHTFQQPPPPIVIRTVYLPKLPIAYPPKKHWVADNSTIFQQWNHHLATYRLSDIRHTHYPTHLVQLNQLQLDVLPCESIIIRDLESREVIGSVVRNYSNNRELLEWATGVLKQSIEINRSARVSTIYLLKN